MQLQSLLLCVYNKTGIIILIFCITSWDMLILTNWYFYALGWLISCLTLQEHKMIMNVEWRRFDSLQIIFIFLRGNTVFHNYISITCAWLIIKVNERAVWIMYFLLLRAYFCFRYNCVFLHEYNNSCITSNGLWLNMDLYYITIAECPVMAVY